MLNLLVYLCPPLAVLLSASASETVKNVGLTLLLYVPGVLHARAAVERYTARRRYDALMTVLDHHTPTGPIGRPKAKRRQTVGPRAA
jgi:uncharacterized membrane protein YqaE (UPF0057 family)